MYGNPQPEIAFVVKYSSLGAAALQAAVSPNAAG